jgi:hypothetical protein
MLRGRVAARAELRTVLPFELQSEGRSPFGESGLVGLLSCGTNGRGSPVNRALGAVVRDDIQFRMPAT